MCETELYMKAEDGSFHVLHKKPKRRNVGRRLFAIALTLGLVGFIGWSLMHQAEDSARLSSEAMTQSSQVQQQLPYVGRSDYESVRRYDEIAKRHQH